MIFFFLLNNTEALGNCKFASCAYRHISNRTNQKVECLEKVDEELKVEIVKLGQNIKDGYNQKMEVLDRVLKALRHDIKSTEQEYQEHRTYVKEG